MATAAATRQFTVSIPVIGLETFNKLAKAFEWKATPIKTKTAEKKMNIAEMYALAEELDKLNNPKGLKITPEEIDEIIEECRSGK